MGRLRWGDCDEEIVMGIFGWGDCDGEIVMGRFRWGYLDGDCDGGTFNMGATIAMDNIFVIRRCIYNRTHTGLI